MLEILKKKNNFLGLILGSRSRSRSSSSFKSNVIKETTPYNIESMLYAIDYSLKKIISDKLKVDLQNYKLNNKEYKLIDKIVINYLTEQFQKINFYKAGIRTYEYVYFSTGTLPIYIAKVKFMCNNKFKIYSSSYKEYTNGYLKTNVLLDNLNINTSTLLSSIQNSTSYYIEYQNTNNTAEYFYNYSLPFLTKENSIDKYIKPFIITAISTLILTILSCYINNLINTKNLTKSEIITKTINVNNGVRTSTLDKSITINKNKITGHNNISDVYTDNKTYNNSNNILIDILPCKGINYDIIEPPQTNNRTDTITNNYSKINTCLLTGLGALTSTVGVSSIVTLLNNIYTNNINRAYNYDSNILLASGYSITKVVCSK